MYSITEEKTKGMTKFRILEILEKETDEDHPMRQKDMLDILRDEGRIIDRKTVKRILLKLRDEFGYDIMFDDKNRFWLNKFEFDNSELRLLMDSIQSNVYLSDSDKSNLVYKVGMLSNKYFKTRMKNVISGDPSRSRVANDLYTNIEVVDEAITLNKKISYIFNRYGADKKMHPAYEHRLKMGKDLHETISPYKIVFKNNRYYAVCGNIHYSEHNPDGRFLIYIFPLDALSEVNITAEDSIPFQLPEGYSNEKDYFNHFLESPDISTKTKQKVLKYELYVSYRGLESILLSFGHDVKAKKLTKDERAKVRNEYEAALYAVTLKTTEASLVDFVFDKTDRIYVRDEKIRLELIWLYERAISECNGERNKEMIEIKYNR